MPFLPADNNNVGGLSTKAFYVVSFSLILSALFHFFVQNRAVVEIEADAVSRSILKIYWKNERNEWSEKRMAQVMLENGSHVYRFGLTDISKVTALRIDPSERVAPVTLKALSIVQPGYIPIELKKPEDMHQIKPLEGVQDLQVTEQGLVVTPLNKDSQLVLDVSHGSKSPTLAKELFNILMIFLFVYIFASATQILFCQHEYVLYLVLAIFVLVLVMATISKFDEHPDERVHVRAGEYYQNHYLPPPIDDESIQDTYSIYGVSRLHSGEIVYLLAGQFSRLLTSFHLQNFISLRIFNVLLLFSLLIMALNIVDFRIFLLPLLVSPQIWYVFSYFNSEAYSVFIMLIAAYQVASPQSSLNRYLYNDVSTLKQIAIVACLGLMLATSLLVKINFYFFDVFLGLYFIWLIYLKKVSFTRYSFYRLLTIFLVGLAIFGSIRFVDNSIHDFKKDDRLLEARERFAKEAYKPSTPLDQKHFYLQMKDRGVSLKRFIQLDRWGEKSFRTAFGVYGHTSISASFAYYDYVRYIGLALCILGGGIILLFGHKEGIGVLVLCATVSLGLILLALHHAWTVDFQAQGRYFLPILGMISILFYHSRDYLLKPFFIFPIFCLYCLSFYNFIFVGLYGIGKVGLG